MTQNHYFQNGQSAGEPLSIAFELVATPALFAFFGWLIDRGLDTKPLFMLLLGLLTAVYTGWKVLRTYSLQMQEHDRNLPSRRAEANLRADADSGSADG